MNKGMNVFYVGAAAALVLGLLSQPVVVSGRAPETFTALAADLSTTGNGGTGRIDITIMRWSTPEEREQLRTVLVEKGTEAVFTALQKMKSVGRVRVNDSLGWDRATPER